MSELMQIYQEVILDHYRKPRNFGHLEGDCRNGDCREADGHNPLCGDKVKIHLRLEGDVVDDITFEGAGCAISTASASLMTEAVKGKSVPEVEELFVHFRAVVTGKEEPGDFELGKLEALSGVRELPVRIKCATLAWHTLQAALSAESKIVSTE
ncbi:MAG: SUF system NifU family Fe-S cluster assembly protein [Holophagales bacterium]|nr:SUF system NifU family Fe-S cluster assembly protein [Holophagales bacterium]